MQPFYISGSNLFTLRTKPTGSGVLKLNLQDMYTLVNTTASISSYTYNAYESLLAFTASVKTLTNGHYSNIIKAFKKGIPNQKQAQLLAALLQTKLSWSPQKVTTLIDSW